MPLNVSTISVDMPRPLSPTVTLAFNLLRDGEVTSGPKTLRIYRGWDTISKLEMVFHADDGHSTRAQIFDQATILSEPDWLACGIDDAAPKRTRAAYLGLQESAEFTFNITSGDGGGGSSGTPATIASIVRVDGQVASRDVVVIEKPSDGQWRIAGYGPTQGGTAELELRVTDGICYAISTDDFGIAFTASLAVQVGQRIRPTQYQGWLYQITEAGQLPVTEPQWWAAEGDNPPRQLGTARAEAVRYYRPLAHGPVPVEIL